MPGPLSQGYFVDLEPRAAAACGGHRFCGPQRIRGAQCPNCSRPLLRLLALEASDARLGLDGAPWRTLPLLFCWRCPIAQSPFSYSVDSDGGVTLLQAGRGAPESDFPYADYPERFPEAAAALRAIPRETQEWIRRLNGASHEEVEAARAVCPDACDLRHQVGGVPRLAQPVSEPACPSCNRAMPFLAAVSDDCLDPRGFTGNPFVQVLFHLCRRCGVVAACQVCD